jgi:hypothetical protein
MRYWAKALGLLALIAMMLGQASGRVHAATPYEEMIQAMEAWIASNPRAEFDSAEAAQVFEWRVGLEKLGYQDRERFDFFRTLLDEIGDRQFVYQQNRYHKRSIQAKILESYPEAHIGEDGVPDPVAFFKDMRAFYKANISSITEQAYWINAFLDFLADFRRYSVEPSVARRMVEEAGEEIHEVVVEFIAIAQYYLAESKDELKNIDYVYTNYSMVILLGSEALDMFLRPLNRFADSLIASLMAKEDRQAIIDFLVPKYADNDTVVKIYSALIN